MRKVGWIVVADEFSIKGYRKFRGRDAKVDALMRDRGFPIPKDTKE